MRKVLAPGLALLLLSCARPPHDPVEAAVRGAVEAAEQRDADALVAFLAPDFRDADGGDRAEAAAIVRRYLVAYEHLSLDVRDLVIERGPGSAQARFTVAMSGTPRAAAGLEGWLPRTSHWRFDLRLEPGDGGWKVTHADWRRLEEGA